MGSDVINAPVKPITDTYQYRSFSLPNELQVLLIHDPETEKAAASMDVSVLESKTVCEHIA